MVSTETKKISINMKLNNGLNSGGNVKTVALSLGSLNVSRYDVDKAIAVINLIKPCLAKSVEALEQSTVSVLVSA